MSDTPIFEPPLVDLFLGPGEGLGSLIVGCDKSIDVPLQLLDGAEGGAVQRLALEDGEPCLDLIEPRRSGWDEMEMDIEVSLEPALVLFIGVEIIQDDVQLAIREGGDEPVHEAEEFDAAAALRMGRDDPAGGCSRTGTCER